MATISICHLIFNSFLAKHFFNRESMKNNKYGKEERSKQDTNLSFSENHYNLFNLITISCEKITKIKNNNGNSGGSNSNIYKDITKLWQLCVPGTLSISSANDYFDTSGRYDCIWVFFFFSSKVLVLNIFSTFYEPNKKAIKKQMKNSFVRPQLMRAKLS